MKYPLIDTEQYKGTITFTPVSEQYLDISRAASEVVNDVIADQFITNQETTFSDPLSAFGGQGRQLKKNVKQIKVSDSVTLYLPQAIAVSDMVMYERLDLGAIGAVGANAIQSGASPKQAAAAAFGEAGKSAFDFMSGRGSLSKELAGLAALRLLPSGTTENVAKTQLGVAVNPNTKSLFRAVELRTFGFTFKMIASSAKEADAIEQIVKIFRTELYPETINTSTSFGGAPIGYKFPNKFDIKLQYNGIELPIKFLRANLINVQTVYNQSSMGWHANGKPSEVDLTLSFGEPRTLSKQDIVDGY